MNPENLPKNLEEFKFKAEPKIEKEKMPESIESGKIRLERMKQEHLEFFYELMRDNENIKYTTGSEEGRTREGLKKDIESWGKEFPFAIYNRETDELIGISIIYPAESPYKDSSKAKEWLEKNKNTWETTRIINKSMTGKGMGGDVTKAMIFFIFRHLGGEKYVTGCAFENQSSLRSMLRAGLKLDPEFRGTDINGVVKDGINEEGFLDRFGKHHKEYRLSLTKSQFESQF